MKTELPILLKPFFCYPNQSCGHVSDINKIFAFMVRRELHGKRRRAGSVFLRLVDESRHSDPIPHRPLRFLLSNPGYTRFPYSYGIDGPYYDLQVESILRTGWLYKDDTPLVFYFFTILSLLVKDITLGIKVGASILSSLIAIPTYLLTKEVTRKRWAGELAAFLILFHPLHMRLLNGFLKNVSGILFLLCSLVFFLRTCEDPKAMNYVYTFVFLLLTFLTHIHPSGLFMPFVAGYISILWMVERKPPKAEIKVMAVLLSSLFLILIVVVLLSPGSLTKFSKVFSFISSLDEETLSELSLFGLREVFTFISIPIVLGLTYLFRDVWRRQTRRTQLLLLSMYIVSLFLTLPLIPRAWRWRFALGNFIPLAFLTAYGLERAERDLPRVAIIGLVVVVFSSSLFDTWLSSQSLRPIIDDTGVRELQKLKGRVPENSIIIVQGRVFYWVQLITGLKTFHGKQNPIQLHQEHGGPVYGLIEKGRRPPPPNIGKDIVLDQGPYIVYRIYPRLVR